jgi:hypothetical protein
VDCTNGNFIIDMEELEKYLKDRASAPEHRIKPDEGSAARERQEIKTAQTGNYTMVAVTFTAYNTRMPGGQSPAPNCPFDAPSVSSLRSHRHVAIGQLRQCVERCTKFA